MSKKVFVIPVILLTIVLGASLRASAQQQPAPPQPVDDERQQMPRPPRPAGDPLMDVMFPPEMIMQHQRELALTDAQKKYMRGELQSSTNRFNELKWQLEDDTEALHDILKGNKVNEKQAMAQLDKVLDAEREIKAVHMAMYIRIKNQLTADQQMKLQTMRNTMQPDSQPRDRRPGGPGQDGPGRPRPGGPDGMRPGGPGGAGPRPGGPPGRPNF